MRAAQEVLRGANGSQADHFPFIRSYFQTIATATVARSARHAKELGYLRPADVVVFNPYEVLYVARTQAKAMAEAGYRPPLPARNVPAAGRTGIATLEMMLVNMREGGFVSPYDFEIGLPSPASSAAARSSPAASSTSAGCSSSSAPSSCGCCATRRRRNASRTR